MYNGVGTDNGKFKASNPPRWSHRGHARKVSAGDVRGNQYDRKLL